MSIQQLPRVDTERCLLEQRGGVPEDAGDDAAVADPELVVRLRDGGELGAGAGGELQRGPGPGA